MFLVRLFVVRPVPYLVSLISGLVPEPRCSFFELFVLDFATGVALTQHYKGLISGRAVVSLSREEVHNEPDRGSQDEQLE